MRLAKDIWHPLIVPLPLAEIVARGSLEGLPLHWAPGLERLQFRADPFGYWRDGLLHMFVERFDYRDPVGTIEVLVFDAAFRFVAAHAVLREPWHLSYPVVFDAEGETWLMPEANQSGRLTLYRARAFPDVWEPAITITVDPAPVDATPLWQEGRWWLFYASTAHGQDGMSALHVAFADRLAGPWTAHPANPVRVDRAGARPGGTPLVAGGRVLLPVQDCARTYGGAIRLLEIDTLTPEHFAARLAARLSAPAAAAPFRAGLHTLAGAGDVTLIDVKRLTVSAEALSLRPRRMLRSLLGRSLEQVQHNG
jgi:hypothetical protein